MSQLLGLLERVKSASEAHDDLDEALWLATIPGAARKNLMDQWPDKDPIWEYYDPERNVLFRGNQIPKLTSSIDAGVRHLQRVLPDWVWGIHPENRSITGHRAYVMKRTPFRPMPCNGHHELPAMALQIAILEALIARKPVQQEQTDAVG